MSHDCMSPHDESQGFCQCCGEVWDQDYPIAPEDLKPVKLCVNGRHAFCRTTRFFGLKRYVRCFLCDLIVEESKASVLAAERSEAEEFDDRQVAFTIWMRWFQFWIMAVILFGAIAGNWRTLGRGSLWFLLFLPPIVYISKLFWMVGEYAILEARERRDKRDLEITVLVEQRNTVMEQIEALRDEATELKEKDRQEKLQELLTLREELEDVDGPA